MKLTHLTVALGFAVLGLSAHAQLTGTLKKIKDTGKVTLGIRESSLPFSYLDSNQKPIGYSVDLCLKIVDAIKKEVGNPGLTVTMQPVTSANRIPLMANGTIDLECGSTTNSKERQQQVAFGVTTFVAHVKVMTKTDSGIKKLDDLNGQPIATTSGTTSVSLIKKHEKGASVNFNEVYGKDHAESFLLVDSGRAKAFVMDDILIAGLIAKSKTPKAFTMLPESLRAEPYGIMLRKDDAPFKAVVDNTLKGLMKSGEIDKIYAKWFTSPIQPGSINLNHPISSELRTLFKAPNDVGVQ